MISYKRYIVTGARYKKEVEERGRELWIALWSDPDHHPNTHGQSQWWLQNFYTEGTFLEVAICLDRKSEALSKAEFS